jgi:hypothetical protein
MNDITEIPTSELENDLAASLQDIKVCTIAIREGIATYSGGSVQDRLDTNRAIVQKIKAELAQREGTR